MHLKYRQGPYAREKKAVSPLHVVVTTSNYTLSYTTDKTPLTFGFDFLPFFPLSCTGALVTSSLYTV